jgi:hypothetical protein
MSGFQGEVDGSGQVIADRVHVDRVLEPRRERDYRLVSVVPRPVEAPVYGTLDAPPERIEQGRSGQRGGSCTTAAGPSGSPLWPSR